MFNQSFKARVDGFDARIRAQKGNNAEQQYVRLHLLFEFDEQLAAEIGGPAPGVYQAMTASYDDGSVGAVPLSLNSRAVNVRFRVGRKNHTVKDTISLDVKAMPPTSKNLSAMLQAKVSFLATEADVATLWEIMGRSVSVKMDRQQLTFPGMGGEQQTIDPDQAGPDQVDAPLPGGVPADTIDTITV